MRLSLRQNEAESDDPRQEVARAPWLLEIVCPRGHHIKQCLVARNQEHRATEYIAEVDEAFIGDCSDPFEGNAAAGIIEDDFYMRAAGDGGEMPEGIEQVGIDQEPVKSIEEDIETERGKDGGAEVVFGEEMLDNVTLDDGQAGQMEHFEDRERVFRLHSRR